MKSFANKSRSFAKNLRSFAKNMTLLTMEMKPFAKVAAFFANNIVLIAKGQAVSPFFSMLLAMDADPLGKRKRPRANSSAALIGFDQLRGYFAQ